MSTANGSDEGFPVACKPPASHFWPKRDQKKRTRDLKVRARGRALIKAAPHLSDMKFRPMLLSLCRITILIEKSYSSIADDESLISADTGELRTLEPFGTADGVVARAVSRLVKLICRIASMTGRASYWSIATCSTVRESSSALRFEFTGAFIVGSSLLRVIARPNRMTRPGRSDRPRLLTRPRDDF